MRSTLVPLVSRLDSWLVVASSCVFKFCSWSTVFAKYNKKISSNLCSLTWRVQCA